MPSPSEEPQEKSISGLAKESGDSRQEQPLSKVKPAILITGAVLLVIAFVVVLIITIGKA